MTTDRFRQDWQGKERAQHYDRNADLLIPKRQEMLDVIVQAMRVENDRPVRVLDLGAGTGALARKVLERFPNATVVCADNSQEMIDIGCAKLEEYGDRVRWVWSDLAKPDWNAELPGPWDAIVSCLTLNLVSDAAKQRIYAQGYQMLTRRGCFINGDRLRGSSPDLEQFYFDHWVSHIVRASKDVLKKDVTFETVAERQRSMDAAARIQPATLEENLAWLRQAGFPVVECLWKDYQRAIFGGFK